MPDLMSGPTQEVLRNIGDGDEIGITLRIKTTLEGISRENLHQGKNKGSNLIY